MVKIGLHSILYDTVMMSRCTGKGNDTYDTDAWSYKVLDWSTTGKRDNDEQRWVASETNYKIFHRKMITTLRERFFDLRGQR